MNKSRICRDFWRKVFNDNLINLQDSDARKEIVNQFFADPQNKGWSKTKDRRFMRLAFSKVAKENNFNPMSVGITPTPSRSKTHKGSMNLNVKSKEKSVPPLQTDAPNQEQLKQDKGKLPIPNQQQIQQQIPQASFYSAQSVGQIFETIFNIFSTRLQCSPLSQNERIALGEAWTPIFNQYFTGENMWVMPAIITAPIVLQRVAEVSQRKKEEELKEKYGVEEPQPEPEDRPTSNKWSKLSHGKD